MEQVCMKIDSPLNLIGTVITNGCSQWSGCWFDAHFIYSLNILLITTTILSEFPLTHRCASYTHKKWNGRTVSLPNYIHGMQENWVQPALPKNLWSSWHVLKAPILSLVGSCLYKRVYSILPGLQHWGNLKKGNLKVIQIRGMIPRWRNTNFVLNGWGSFTG